MPPPAPPQNLTATASGQAITLSWERTSPGTVNLYRGTSSGEEATTACSSGNDSTTYTDISLQPSTTYYYIATTVNNGIESGPSNEASATTGS